MYDYKMYLSLLMKRIASVIEKQHHIMNFVKQALCVACL